MPGKAILLAGAMTALVMGAPARAQVVDRSVLPIPTPEFKGVIGPSFESSKQDYAQPVQAPKGAPNVVLILLDDLGFGQAGSFGGPVPTPNIDRLAKHGLKYNRFHTTGICSPTRAALLTGRNHHQSGNGTITELSTGYPGYHSVWPKSVAAIPEVLKQNGYSTAAWGKWHNTPDWETSATGPFNRWPTGQGFEYFYGFQGGETSQWEPQLFRGNSAVEPKLTPAQGYNLNTDLANDAISWVNSQQSLSPDKPFFIYYATGGVHAPLHAPKEWIAKFKGQFDQGWDKVREETLARQIAMGVVPAGTKLTARPKEIAAWASLSADEKRLFARHQEVFAGYLAQTDHEVGRLLDAIAKLPNADNTLIIYVLGDNGPSAEGTLTGTTNNMMTQNGVPDSVVGQLKHLDEIGGPGHENQYPVGWAWAGSAPFQWMKRVPSHFGGTRNAMVMSWPAKITDTGGLRSQFHHVIDVAPTIYAAAGVPMPTRINGVEQVPLAGVAMEYSFASASAPEQRLTQYFETGGHRAIYDHGWTATAFHGVPWALSGSVGNFDKDRWELYHVDADFSQSNDLAASNPARLKAMQAIFDAEAVKYNVLPLDDRFVERATNPDRPSANRGRSSFVYAAGSTRITEGSAPPVYQRSHTITANIDVPSGGADGVLIAEGGGSGGYTLFIEDGRPVYEYNFFGHDRYTLSGAGRLPTGKVKIELRYVQGDKAASGGGSAVMLVNGAELASGKVDRVVAGRFSATETLDIGMDLGSVVSRRYAEQAPFAYKGTIDSVAIDLLP